MAVFAGPKTVSDGLVFQIDQDNTQKSFRGKPTTNLLLSSTQNHTGGMGAYWYGVISTNNSEKGFPSFKVTTVDDANNKSDGFITSNGGNLTDGTTYTWSADVWIPTGKSVMLRIRNISGGYYRSGSNVTVNGSSSWVRVSRTFTADTNTAGRIEGQSQDPASDVYSFWVKNLQIEENDFATPFVAGTRSNTQSIIDIIGGRTITAHYLTYNSDGTFTFGGSPDSIEIDTASVPSGNQITFECWAKVNTVSSSSIIEAKTSGDSRTINVHLPWGNNIVYFDCGGGSGSYQRITYETNASQRTGWHHWVFTKNATTGIMAMYLDGKLLTSSSGQTNTIGETATVRLGSYATGSSNFWQGELDQARLYNKALTVNEIMTNFEASRDRYGV